MEDEKAKQICDDFLKLLMGIGTWMHRHNGKIFNINGKGEFQVTAQQFNVLHCVFEIKQCTISKLEERLYVSRSSLSLLVSKMVKEGYIIREYPSEEEDRRKTYLKLTEKGMEVINKVYHRIMGELAAFYHNLPQNKQDDFKEAVEKLNTIF
jgi:DNA-binding MarR family transcriptional regulator